VSLGGYGSNHRLFRLGKSHIEEFEATEFGLTNKWNVESLKNGKYKHLLSKKFERLVDKLIKISPAFTPNESKLPVPNFQFSFFPLTSTA
jgi:hypothetical protein